VANAILIPFLIFVLLAVIVGCGEVVMRVRLSKREPPSERLLWWRRGGDEVASSYLELFPRSFLPRLRDFTFWLFLIFAASLLTLIVWKKI
jgi:hypothetical protein